MRQSVLRLLTLSTLMLVAGSVQSQTITVGSGVSTNAFPFALTQSGFAGTIYQQVYAASDFAGAGTLQSVSFLGGSGTLRTGTYDLYVSTTTAAVNALNTSNFDANRGANNTLFATLALSGAAPATLTFTGTPFLYNPALGNLLLDFRVSNISGGFGTAQYLANNGDAGGVYSRAHNFGTATDNYGLQTRFVFVGVTAVPEPGTVALLGAGLAALAFVRRRRVIDA